MPHCVSCEIIALCLSAAVLFGLYKAAQAQKVS